MQRSNFIYTLDPVEALRWDLSLKFISSDETIFYTARVFFRSIDYFKALFNSGMKESRDNTIRLLVPTSTLHKYFLLFGEDGFADELTDQELVDLAELSDQHGLRHIIDRLIDPLIERMMIDADDLFRLINQYNLTRNIPVYKLIRMSGLGRQLNHLGELVVWACFSQACLQVGRRVLPSDEEEELFVEYKDIIMGCHDRFLDKVLMIRHYAQKHLTHYLHVLSKSERDSILNALTEAGLFDKTLTPDFRNTLLACVDIFLSIKKELQV